MVSLRTFLIRLFLFYHAHFWVIHLLISQFPSTFVFLWEPALVNDTIDAPTNCLWFVHLGWKNSSCEAFGAERQADAFTDFSEYICIYSPLWAPFLFHVDWSSLLMHSWWEITYWVVLSDVAIVAKSTWAGGKITMLGHWDIVLVSDDHDIRWISLNSMVLTHRTVVDSSVPASQWVHKCPWWYICPMRMHHHFFTRLRKGLLATSVHYFGRVALTSTSCLEATFHRR